MKLYFQWAEIILILGSLQGFLLGGLLIFRGIRLHTSYYFLGSILCILAYNLGKAALDFAGITDYDYIRWGLLVQFDWALGPLLYFYVFYTHFPTKSWKTKNFLHFIPLSIQLILSLVDTYVQWLWWIDRPSIHNGHALFYRYYSSTSISDLITVLIAGIYLYHSLRLLRSEKVEPTRSLQTWWLAFFLYSMRILIGALLLVIWVDYVAASVVVGYAYYGLYLLMVVFIYGLGLRAYRRRNSSVSSVSQASISKNREVSRELLQKVIQTVEKQQLYLDPQLNLRSLAQRFNISSQQLSHLINQGLHKNFNEFINEYRVKEAQTRLLDPRYQHLTVLAIAYDSGFNSKASFNRAFKQFTQCSPQDYRKQSSHS